MGALLIVNNFFASAKFFVEFCLKLGAIQKLRNGQSGERVDDFVAYRYVYFEEDWGIL